MRHTIWLAAGAGTIALFTSCSGGGSGTTGAVQGLTAPGTVSVVSADTSELDTGATASGNTVTPGSSPYPIDSDYNTDEARVYVYDPSMEPLTIINSILSDTSKTAYDQMVNYGPYNAQITPTEDKGAAKGTQSTDTGQSSGAQGDNFEIFVVDSQRATNSSPQTVYFWVPESHEEHGGPSEEFTIHAKMSISEGSSATDPFGQFSLTFAGAANAAGLSDPNMWGVLATTEVAGDDIGFTFFEKEGDLTLPHSPGDRSNQVQINVTMSSDQETGAAKIIQQFRGNHGMGDSGLQEESWQVAFNSTHFKRQKDEGDVVTLSREDFKTMVWRYNLYHAEGANIGQRVDLNSGFGFRVGEEGHGWVGYHGIWTPDEITLENGDTIVEETYSDEQGDEFTVVLAPGKLMKHTKNEMDLVDIGTNTFQWWDWNAQTQYMVDYYTGSFWKVATFNEETHEWDTMGVPEQIDVAALGGWLHMWSDSLGGSVSYIDGTDYITYYEQEFINGSSTLFEGDEDGRVALYGYIDCLKANLTGTNVESGEIFLANSEDVEDPHVYRFDADDLTLYYDSAGDDSNPQVVGLLEGEAPTSGPNMWGMHSGPMVLDTAGVTNPWDLWDADVFYTYETGHNEWNQYGAVKDSAGDFVEFDPPLQFLYTHTTAADRNGDATYDGSSYFLNYGGNGDLWGIPWEGADLKGEGEFDRWYPIFCIADGTLMGPSGTEYVLRAIEMEQSLQEDPGAAPELDITAADDLVLPDESVYSTPVMGDKPVIDDPPAVIDGEVQVDL